jgi:hypothetical protein
VEVWSELLRPEPDEDAAQEVEENVPHKLCRRDADACGQGIGDAVI